jgi:hypothetical protein
MVAVANVHVATTPEATGQLQRALQALAAAEPSDSRTLDQARVVRLIGEYLLAVAYRDRQDPAALASQLDVLRKLLAELESSPPLYSDGLDHWALPLVLHCVRRDLAGFSTENRP